MIKTDKKLVFISIAIVITTMAIFIFTGCDNTKSDFIENKKLILYNYKTGTEIKSYDVKSNSSFSIGFIHSVNKSPVVDYYHFDDNNDIYVYKTVYYGFGAGVQTELNDGETITYGKDGSMTIEHIDKKIDELIYYISSVSDHKLCIDDDKEISLWDVCGKNKIILFKIVNP